MHSLPIFVRLNGDPVLVLGDGDAADAKRRLVERAGGTVTGPGDPSLPRLAFIAHEDPDQARTAADYCRRRGMLVNVVDQPELCDFTTPSIVDRDPVIIAVGTGGASAGLAKHVRLRLEALLPPGLGLLAQSLDKARLAIRARFPDQRARRAALDAGMAPGGPLDPLGPDPETAVARWLAEGDRAAASLRHEVIILTSTDPDELTLRQARLLGEADAVRHAADVPEAILRRARADAVMLPLDSAAVELSCGLVIDLMLA